MVAAGCLARLRGLGLVGEQGDQRRVQHDRALVAVAHIRQQRVGFGFLEHVTAGAQAQGSEQFGAVHRGREHHHLAVQAQLAQFVQHLQTAEARHVQVQQHLLGRQAHGQVDAFSATGRLPHHFEVVAGVEQLRQAFAKQRVIIDQ